MANSAPQSGAAAGQSSPAIWDAPDVDEALAALDQPGATAPPQGAAPEGALAGRRKKTADARSEKGSTPAIWDAPDVDEALAALGPPPAPAATEKPSALKEWWKTLNTPYRELLNRPHENEGEVNKFIRETLLNPGMTGADKAKQVGAVLASPVRSTEATAESIADAQKETPPPPEFIKAADEQFSKTHSFFGALDVYLHNPKWAFASFVQGMTQGAGVLGAATAAGAAGGPLGAAAGAGGAGYLDKYGETILSTLSANGVDLSDKTAVQQALENPELMQKANAAAAKAGVPAAVINALSFGVMGRVAGPVTRKLGGNLAARAAGAGGEVATQGAIGAGGEAARQEYEEGKITNPGAIPQAAVQQVATTAPFVVHGLLPHPDRASAAARPDSAADPVVAAGDALNAVNVEEGAVRPSQHDGVVESPPQNAVEHARELARRLAAALGGDALDQTVAAIHANAAVGGVYDAAAVHQARMETRRAQVEEDVQNTMAAHEAFQREQDASSAERQRAQLEGFQQPPTADQAFAAREAEQATQAQKDRDFTAARNQVGQEQTENALGEVKGGSQEPAPTMADALPPEQVSALAALRERIAAQRKNPEPAVAPKSAEPVRKPVNRQDQRLAAQQADQDNEIAAAKVAEASRVKGPLPGEQAETFQDRRLAKAAAENEQAHVPLTLRQRRAQAKIDKEAAATAEDSYFEPLAEEAPAVSRSSQEAPVEPERDTEAPAKAPKGWQNTDDDDDGDLPERGPAPVTAQSLAERRRAALDKAMADKVGGRGRQVADTADTQPAEKPAENARVPTQAAEIPAEPVARQPANRLAAIRAAAEKRQQVEEAARQAATHPDNEEQPTTAQQNAGNFQMGHTEVQGIPVSIEHPEGSTRPSGATIEGGHYGYIKGTVGADGMHVDAFVGKNPESTKVWVVDHNDTEGKWQQHKVLLGFKDKDAAMEAYKSAFDEKQAGAVHEVSTDRLKNWLKHGDTTKPYANEVKPRGALASRRAFNAAEPASRQERQYVARNADTGDEVARYDNYEDARQHKERFPTDDITHEPKESPRYADTNVGDLSAAPGLQLRRLAATGDVDAQAELKRRANSQTAAAHPDANAPPVPGERRGPPITKEEATARLQPLIDRLGPGRVHVHDGLDDPAVPEHIRRDAQLFNHPDPRGAWDPKDGSLHIFAGAKGHPDLESLHNTAIHELAHIGLHSFLGEDFGTTLSSIFDNVHGRAGALRSPIDGVRKASAREWMEDYVAQHAMNPRDPRHQMLAAEEYVASLAEHDLNDPLQRNPSLLRTLYDAVRAGLRKLGVVHAWTDADLRRLIRHSSGWNNADSPHAKAARALNTGIRWSDSEDRSVERLPQDDPQAIAAKYRRVLADSANYNPGYVKSRFDAVAEALRDSLPHGMTDTWEKAKEIGHSVLLYSIPTDKIPDLVNPELNPSVRQYVETVRGMSGRVGALLSKAHDTYKPWNDFARKDPKRAAMLDNLMPASRIARVDVSKPFENLYSDEQHAKSPTKAAADEARRAAYTKLRAQFEELGEEGQRIYTDVRDAYKRQRAEYRAAQDQRMAELGMSAEKRTELAALTEKYAGSRIEPYFPLPRWGDRFAVARDKETGEIYSYSRFETKSQQQAWISQMQKEGYNVTNDRDSRRSKDSSRAVDPAFLNKVLELTKDFEPKDGGTPIADEIYQHYLNSLPDRSYSKSFMRAKDRLGFAGNQRRAFADQSLRNARAVGAAEYSHRLDAVLDAVSSEHKQLGELASQNPDNRYLQREQSWAPEIREALARHRTDLQKPTSNLLADALTHFGFHYFLGFNPATAARIHTQQYINALPWLSARHGAVKAASALSTAMKDYAFTRGGFGNMLRGDERLAWDEMQANGTFMNTQAQSLASASRGDTLQRAGESQWAKARATAAVASTWMFNGVEHFNRETTAMAAYRLARDEGVSHDAALRHAMLASDTTHFNYAPENRPAILRGFAGKVGGLFAQYSVHQAYRIVRDFRDGVFGNQNIAPEERSARLKTLAGMYLASTLIAGVGATMAPVFGAVNLALNTGSDKPNFDSKAALHGYLAQHLGPGLANAVMFGPVAAAADANLSSTGLWDVFHRESGGDTRHENWYTRIAQYVPVFGSMLQGGPLGEVGQDIGTGVEDARAGDVERAIEHWLPMGFRGAPKAIRHALYGEESPKALALDDSENNKVMPSSEFGVRAFLAQLANFQPVTLAARREENEAKLNEIRSVEEKRAAIVKQYTVAHARNDSDGMDAARALADKFNDDNDEILTAKGGVRPLYPLELIRAANGAERREGNEDHGISIPRGMEDYLEERYGHGETQ